LGDVWDMMHPDEETGLDECQLTDLSDDYREAFDFELDLRYQVNR